MMKAQRLEAFTDGVFAIIITITVLEMKVPESAQPAALLATLPILLAYALSFVNVGIFWANHHHLLQATKNVSGRVLWANLSLLFWLSLVPFVIRWVDDQGISPWPTAAYGFTLLMASISYVLTEKAIVAINPDSTLLQEAIGKDMKGLLSLVLYAGGTCVALYVPFAAVAAYLAVSAMWLIPDRRIERRLLQ